MNKIITLCFCVMNASILAMAKPATQQDLAPLLARIAALEKTVAQQAAKIQYFEKWAAARDYHSSSQGERR